MILRKLFDKYNCDKGYKHGYERTYEFHFRKHKNKPIKILEIGCFKGESLNVWLEFFPNAEIYTIDIFARTSPKDIKVLENPRVHWMKADSTDAGLVSKIWSEWGSIEFDFIIDDGAHWPKSNMLTFENLIRVLKDTGIYIIEDVWPLDKMDESSEGNDWLKRFPDRYNILDYNLFLSKLEKYNVEHIDYRKTNCPDSYLIVIKK